MSWLPTSADTLSSACCAVRAPVWMVSLVLTTRLVSERSASSTWDLMLDDSSSARDIRSSLAWRPLLSMRPATASTREPSRSSNCATRTSMSLATEPTLVSMAWWMSWKRAVTVSVRCMLRPSMISVTPVMRRSTASIACAVPSVSVEVSSVSRVSIDCTACEAPSVSAVVRWVRRESMASSACDAPPVRVVVRCVRRVSIDWIVCDAPSVRVVVRWVRRESMDWIACAAPSVSVLESEFRRTSMVSVTERARVSNDCSRALTRPTS